jgi:signal transduction histidine kinase
VLQDAVRSLWVEPRTANPPKRLWRDWALVAGLLLIVVVEVVVRTELVWRGVSLGLFLMLAPLLLVRRTHPLLAATITFGSIAIVDVASLLADVHWEGPSIAVFVVLFPYALVRWGAGREIAIGLSVVLIPVALSWFDPIPIGERIAGTFVVPFIAAIAAAVRYQDTARVREIDQVKMLEREQLARELHDTVAHHVSAIAISAQAGRVVAASNPAAALEALAIIEEEASRTLEEMRAMVGALRQTGRGVVEGEEANLAPQRGIADIEHLAKTAGEQPHVDVELSGDLDGLRPSVDAAVYRLAQESITNAVRHARHATRIHVTVHGDHDNVHLTVGDDGEAGSEHGGRPFGFATSLRSPLDLPAGPRSTSGFGLIGMAERAKLLGGTLQAGPSDGSGSRRGWTVHAVLPRGRGGS